MITRKPPDTLEQYLHDVCHLTDEQIEAKYYTTGIAWPRYPVPAIPLSLTINDLQGEWMHSMVYLSDNLDRIVCLWDMNFDRALDLGYEPYVYTLPDQIQH